MTNDVLERSIRSGEEEFQYLKAHAIREKSCDLEHDFAFISYSHTPEEDAAIVKQVFSELYDSGYNLWIDTANLPVDAGSWETPAMDALRSPNCKLLIFFRSRSSLTKDTIERELKTFTEDGRRTIDHIITVDLSRPGEENTEPFLRRLREAAQAPGAGAGEQKAFRVCSAICGVVSSHCNALRYHRDFSDLSAFIGALMREMAERNIRQNFSLQEKIEYVLDGSFHVLLNAEQEKIMNHFLALRDGLDRDPDMKRGIIVGGRPGVGKTVLSMAMLSSYVRILKSKYGDGDGTAENDPVGDRLSFLYVSRNKALRMSYAATIEDRLKGAKKRLKEAKDDPELQKEAARYERISARFNKVFKGSVRLGDSYGELNCVDVIVADEAHRLEEKNRLDSGKAQPDIIARAARLSIFFCDTEQMVTYMDFGTKENLKNSCKKFCDRIYVDRLRAQMRCGGADSFVDWVDSLMEEPGFDPPETVAMSTPYDLRVFDDPNELFAAIEERNAQDRPARVCAGICWPWDEGKEDDKVKDVKIPEFGFERSWNLDYGQKKLTFATDENAVRHVGCIHTVQGLEFTYVGVIIGMDLGYDPVEKRLVIDPLRKVAPPRPRGRRRKDEAPPPAAEEHPGVIREHNGRAIHGIGTLEREAKAAELEAAKALRAGDSEEYHRQTSIQEQKTAEVDEHVSRIIRNIYRVLLTRGKKGCYIYCQDPELQKYMKKQAALYLESLRECTPHRETRA